MLGRDLSVFSKKEVSDLSSAQYDDMSRMKYLPLATKKVSILYGEKEDNSVKNRSVKLSQRIGYRIIEVPEARHELTALYVQEIGKIL
jgi:hypothetical protein